VQILVLFARALAARDRIELADDRRMFFRRRGAGSAAAPVASRGSPDRPIRGILHGAYVATGGGDPAAAEGRVAMAGAGAWARFHGCTSFCLCQAPATGRVRAGGAALAETIWCGAVGLLRESGGCSGVRALRRVTVSASALLVFWDGLVFLCSIAKLGLCAKLARRRRIAGPTKHYNRLWFWRSFSSSHSQRVGPESCTRGGSLRALIGLAGCFASCRSEIEEAREYMPVKVPVPGLLQRGHDAQQRSASWSRPSRLGTQAYPLEAPFPP